VSREKFVNWAASVLVAATVSVLVAWLGGPSWAIYGFGYLTFLVLRAQDYAKGRP
jgi:hypothetical protein